MIGYLSHGAKGAVIGAAAGAGGGFLIGHLMDSRRCGLYKIAQANQLNLASASITPGKLGLQGKDANSAIGLDVQLQNKSDEFEVGSSKLTRAARAYLAQIAQLYAPQAVAAGLPASASPQERQQATQHSVLIVGHTDAQDATSGADLARLSQERAKAVADVFAQNGVPASNIYYQGAGDALPLMSNTTQQGREANDRVQIVDVPTQGDLQLYLQRRGANPANFDHVATMAGHAAENTGADTSASRDGAALPTANTSDTPAPQTQASTRGSAAKQAAVAAQSPSAVAKPPRSIAATAPVQTARNAPAQRSVHAGSYDFGGGPIHPPGEPINLGAAVDHSMFSLITSAHADTPVIVGSCLSDHPHPTTPVRNLKTAQELPPRDFARGFYGTVWGTNANGNLVAITGATIPLDAGAPIPRPTVLIYRNYQGNVHQAPSFKGQANVNVYRGTQKTVYRVFIDGPARCLDLVVADAQFKGQGNLYYDDNGSAFLATPEFAMQR
ncbi:OmpA family protein [Paraburkholderia sp. J67]|uniref:OmpA family protein n=1 Tax=Paraburkholderia sp. J67 TaxID=2805435 RepID=UPI0039F5A624